MTDLQALMTKTLKRNNIPLEGEDVLNCSIKSNKITVEIGKSNDPSKDYFTTTYSVEINPEKETINGIVKSVLIKFPCIILFLKFKPDFSYNV